MFFPFYQSKIYVKYYDLEWNTIYLFFVIHHNIKNQTIINYNIQERKIQHILENTGGYFIDLSLPLPNTIVDVIWRNRQQDHIYTPCFPISYKTISLEDILFESNQEPYHTLKK